MAVAPDPVDGGSPGELLNHVPADIRDVSFGSVVRGYDRREVDAYVKRVNVDYYTDAIRYTQVRVLETAAGERIEASGADARASRSHGDVLVRSQVVDV